MALGVLFISSLFGLGPPGPPSGGPGLGWSGSCLPACWSGLAGPLFA